MVEFWIGDTKHTDIVEMTVMKPTSLQVFSACQRWDKQGRTRGTFQELQYMYNNIIGLGSSVTTGIWLVVLAEVRPPGRVCEGPDINIPISSVTIAFPWQWSPPIKNAVIVSYSNLFLQNSWSHSIKLWMSIHLLGHNPQRFCHGWEVGRFFTYCYSTSIVWDCFCRGNSDTSERQSTTTKIYM